MTSSIDVSMTVHVEEHRKFFQDCHVGHSTFLKLLLERKHPLALTLLIARVKEEPTCPGCDRSLLQEIAASGTMEVGLHVHPALSRYRFEEQRRIIREEFHRFVEGTGIVPTSFSGGHWCINTDTLRVIRELGLLVDASVAPGCRVSACNGTVIRYSRSRTTPYWVSLDRIDAEDPAGNLLEMPVSVSRSGALLDVTTMPLWDLQDHIRHMARQPARRHYLHLTFHSYDVLFATGGVNFIYDKILYVDECLRESFDDVCWLTCTNAYRLRRKEGGHEDHSRA